MEQPSNLGGWGGHLELQNIHVHVHFKNTFLDDIESLTIVILRQGRFQGNGLRGPCGDCSPPATCTCPDGNQQNVSTLSPSFPYDKMNSILMFCILDANSQ